MIVQPFIDQGYFTGVHNCLFDTVMPSISASAWKVLSFIIRQTIGWRRTSWGLSYADLKAGTGIRSGDTITHCIAELLEAKLIIVEKSPDQWTSNRYSLNRKVEIEWEPGRDISPFTPKIGSEPTPKIGSEPTPKIGSEPTPKIGVFNRKEKSLSKNKGNKGRKKNTRAIARSENPPPVSPPGQKLSDQSPDLTSEQAYDLFLAGYRERYEAPYQGKKADFVQFAALLKTCRKSEWPLTEERFKRGLGNYFQTPQGSHTMADFCTRFSPFYQGAMNEYGKRPQEGAKPATNGNGKLYGAALEEYNRRSGEEWLRQRAEAREKEANNR